MSSPKVIEAVVNRRNMKIIYYRIARRASRESSVRNTAMFNPRPPSAPGHHSAASDHEISNASFPNVQKKRAWQSCIWKRRNSVFNVDCLRMLPHIDGYFCLVARQAAEQRGSAVILNIHLGAGKAI